MPTITGVSGSTVHGGALTITGTDFGTKPTPGPLVWDDASGLESPLDVWTGAWPNTSGDTNNRMKRRGVIRDVQPPHSRTGRYLAGAHSGGSDAMNGFNVLVWRQFPFTAGMSLYASCYMRLDPAWTWSLTVQDNLKMFTWRMSPGPITTGTGITMNFGGSQHPPSLDPAGQDLNKVVKWQCYSSVGDLTVYDTNGQPYPSGQVLYSNVGDAWNPIIDGWCKYEVVLKAGDPGIHRIYENGRQVYGYAQHVDTNTSPSRVFVFGEFARPYWFPTNWRYITDCYLDLTHARVILGNAPILNNTCTIREPQVCSTWSVTGITILSMNRGAIPDGAGAYLFVVDSANVASAGFEIGDAPDPPDPPDPPLSNLVSAEIVPARIPAIAGVRF